MRNVFKVISSIISKWMKTDIHNKDFARRFALKKRLKWTRKWPIVYIILLAGWFRIIDLPDCFGINLLSTFSDVFGQTRFIIFRSSVSLAFMFPRSLMLREVRIRAKRVVLNETVPSSFSGMFILIRRWREKKAYRLTVCAADRKIQIDTGRRATEAGTGGAYADFYSMDQLGLFLLSPLRGTIVSQGKPFTSLEPIYT